jgi:S1-C subfamily serine protease
LDNKDKLQILTIVVLIVSLAYVLENVPNNQTPVVKTDSLNQNILNHASAIEETQEEIQKPIKNYDYTFTKIYNEVKNSVVQIKSTKVLTNSRIIINGNPLDQETAGLGSGFVYDFLGHILTNNHVIDGADKVEVTFNNGDTYQAKIIGTDTYSDIAVLELTEDFSSESIVPLNFSDSSILMVGEPAIAIGNPFGLSNSMTTGIISQTGRLLPNQDNGGFSIPDVIQTDAAINPGNSGGPLLDIEGKVIGMNTAIQTKTGEFSGIGFAIPSNSIKKIVPELIQKGEYSHPWLGISGMDVDPKIADSLNLSKNYKGVAIVKLVNDGPAQKAGLKDATLGENQEIQKADIIVSIDGQPVKSMADTIYYISNKNVGDKVIVTVNRDGKTIDFSVVLESRPKT